MKTAEIAAFWGRCEHVHLEKAGILQDLLQQWGSGFPIVVILTIDNQSAQEGRRKRLWNQGAEQKASGNSHGSPMWILAQRELCGASRCLHLMKASLQGLDFPGSLKSS
jgi:hypothetical protein